MGKATKATRKFAASGQLKKTIQARHKRQEVRKKIQARKTSKAGKPQAKTNDVVDGSDEEESDEEPHVSTNKKGYVVIP